MLQFERDLLPLRRPKHYIGATVAGHRVYDELNFGPYPSLKAGAL